MKRQPSNPHGDPPFPDIKKFYKGFTITGPFGNNAFSFEGRVHKEIYVPAIIRGTPDDLAMGERIVFSEVKDGKEVGCLGLKTFIHYLKGGKDIFIFDNHNHAFFFWAYAASLGKIPKEAALIHIDQHKDSRKPEIFLDQKQFRDLSQVFRYTNAVLNVGNFIEPALHSGIFKDVVQMTDSNTFQTPLSQPCVLDLDMDIFAPEMKYMDERIKFNKIKDALRLASVVTIATSPFFMNQQEAIRIIKEIFKNP